MFLQNYFRQSKIIKISNVILTHFRTYGILMYKTQTQEASDGLRSALEAKAKREAAAGVNTSGAPKGKKKKAGRTKSLADLPALSAWG